jgi:hypothetical protein
MRSCEGMRRRAVGLAKGEEEEPGWRSCLPPVCWLEEKIRGSSLLVAY